MSKRIDRLSDEELIYLAREKLPLPSACRNDEYMVPLLNDTSIPPYMQTSLPPKGEVQVINVLFRKNYISGIAVGWGFAKIDR